jgi:deazaflavin-dependent oxidoreductase (nitroreductase family)
MNQSGREIIPYPSGVVSEVLRLPLLLYRLGLGPLVNLLPLLIITTRGRKSGRPRHSVLEYRRHGTKHYVVSAWGRRTQWLQNLLAHPLVTVQKGQDRFGARATLVEDSGEALRVLYLFRKKAPIIYDAVLARLSDRESVNARNLPDISSQIVIVRLEPVVGEPTPPALPSDLAWTLRLAVLSLLAFMVVRLVRQWYE